MDARRHEVAQMVGPPRMGHRSFHGAAGARRRVASRAVTSPRNLETWMPFKVLIAGAGPAGLEAALALRDLAGERVEITLLAPDDELTYRPLSVAEPFSLATTRRYPLDTIARDLGVERVVDRLA